VGAVHINFMVTLNILHTCTFIIRKKNKALERHVALQRRAERQKSLHMRFVPHLLYPICLIVLCLSVHIVHTLGSFIMRFTVIVPQLVSIEEKTDIVYEEIVCSQWHNKKLLITRFDKYYKFQKKLLRNYKIFFKIC